MGGKGSVNNPDDITRKSSPSVTDEIEYDEISETDDTNKPEINTVEYDNVKLLYYEG